MTRYLASLRKLFTPIIIGLLVGVSPITGFYLSGILTFYPLIVIILLMIIVNMAVMINSDDDTILFFVFALSAWFLMGLFIGFVVHRLGY